MKRLVLVALSAVALLTACDNTDPVSPQALTVIVNAEPPSVEPGQTSTITVSAFRPEGDPARRAPVQLETTLGQLTRTQFLLDGRGRGSTVLEAGTEAGTATLTAIVTVGAEEMTGTVDVEIVASEPPEAFLAVSPTALDLQHSRGTGPCPDPFTPALSVSPVGATQVNYRVVENLPTWLMVDASSGAVPATVIASYTCAADDEGTDLDLAHPMQFQATDRTTGNDLGEPVEVAVTLRVRD